MIRRQLLVALGFGLASLSSPVLAQRPTKIPAVGVLLTHVSVNDPITERLRQSLRDLGYEEGRNISLRILTAEGQVDRLPALAAELVDQGVDVIVATSHVSTIAAQKATAKIPSVMAGYGYDPISLGLIDNVRRPGGNTTGVYSSTPDLEGKRLEVLKQAVPQVAHVAVLWEPAYGESALSDLRHAAEMLHVRLEFIEVHSGDDLKSAFETAKRKKVGAALLVFSPIFYLHRDRVTALTLETKLPTISPLAGYGTLIAYGPDNTENMTRAAYYVDRLLKGAKPGDLPVEQLSAVRLFLNLKMAKELGITIPQSLVLRADEVIR